MHLHVLAVIFRLIWLRRNKMKYERKLTPLQHIPAPLKAEMTRVIAAKWNSLLHTIHSRRIQAHKHNPIFNPAPLIAHFKACWAIPSSFVLKENQKYNIYIRKLRVGRAKRRHTIRKACCPLLTLRTEC